MPPQKKCRLAKEDGVDERNFDNDDDGDEDDEVGGKTAEGEEDEKGEEDEEEEKHDADASGGSGMAASSDRNAEKNARAFEKLVKPIQIGSISWHGSEAELVTAIDKGIMDLGKLLADSLSVAKASKQAPAHKPTPAPPETGAGSVVTVRALSGKSIEIALTSASTTLDLRLKVASWLEMLPCEFAMVHGTARLADHEVLSVSGGVIDVVVRNVKKEAKGLASDLACCSRALQQAGFAVSLPGVDAAGIPGVLHRLYAFASKPLLQATVVDSDFGMWVARILERLDFSALSELGLYLGIREIDEEGQRLGLESPLILLGHALKASDGGISAAAMFVTLCYGERWCAATVGEAFMGQFADGMRHSAIPGVGSSLAQEFRDIIAKGPEAAALDCLCTCILASAVDGQCSVPLLLAGMAGSAAAAWKEGGRQEPEVQGMAAGLLVTWLDRLWPERGGERGPETEAAEEIFLKDLVNAGLADPSTKELAPFADEKLTEEQVTDLFGVEVEEIICGFYDHTVGSKSRPSSWDPES